MEKKDDMAEIHSHPQVRRHYRQRRVSRGGLGGAFHAALFGYNSAEECILDGHSNEAAAWACQRLYPSVDE